MSHRYPRTILTISAIILTLAVTFGWIMSVEFRENGPVAEPGPRLSDLVDQSRPSRQDGGGEDFVPAMDSQSESEPEPWLRGRYVGAEVCGDCHEERVDDFIHTSHFHTSRLPDLSSLETHLVKAGELLETREAGTRFAMSIADGQFRQTGIQKDGVAGGGERVEGFDVDLVYGAGDFDEDYFYWDENRLFQMPVVYQNGLQCWTNAPGYMDGRVEFRRPVAPRCVECHATWVNHIPGTMNTYQREKMVLGVSCEKCHGPGEFHVDYHREHPDAQQPSSIAMPADMSRSQQMDLCAQCHSNANKRRTPPFSYRPGDSLEDHFRIDLNNHPEEDHTSNQHRYLQESTCYQASETMTCVTCHDPHLPTKMARTLARESCSQCHEPKDCGEHVRLPNDLQSKCVDCHMPYEYVNNITFDLADDQYVPIIQRHDHRIAVNQEASDLTRLRWLESQLDDESKQQAAELRQRLVEQKRNEADGYEQEDRFLAAAGVLRELLLLEEDEAAKSRLKSLLQTRRELDQKMAEGIRLIGERDYDAAIQQFEFVVAKKPVHAAAHGKLGLLLIETGREAEGIEHLEKVSEIDPDNGYGHALLGYLYLTKNDLQTSREYYLRAEACEPYNAKIKRYLGQIAFRQGQSEDAESYWRSALKIEPQNLEVLSTMVNYLTEKQRRVDAVLLVEKCVERTQGTEPQLLVGLADLYLLVGREDRAVETLREAKIATSQDNPQLLQTIHQMLQRLGEAP